MLGLDRKTVRRCRRVGGILASVVGGALLAMLLATLPAVRPVTQASARAKPAAKTAPPRPAKIKKATIFRSEQEPPGKSHPRHMVKVWLTTHKGRTFRVIQLPRCEHMEAVLAYEPRGETKERAKERLGGVAVCTGSFHNSRTMALADFLQKEGSIISGASTGRWFFAVLENGDVDISDNYLLVKGKSGVSALALGQRLVPLHRDGFSKAFMNRVTDRMAVGLSYDYVFIVQGRSDLWRLADFMGSKLPCKVAVNADGGHVVRGRSPVHIVFRWRKPTPAASPSPAEKAEHPGRPERST